MLKKVIIVLVLIFTSCKNQKEFTSKKSESIYDYDLVIIYPNCNDDFNLVKIDDKTSIKIRPNLCVYFKDLLLQKKKVELTIHGYLIDNSFHLDSGSYYVFESIDNSKNCYRKIGKYSMDFTNFGFVENYDIFEKSILYKISNASFEIIRIGEKTVKRKNERINLRFYFQT